MLDEQSIFSRCLWLAPNWRLLACQSTTGGTYDGKFRTKRQLRPAMWVSHFRQIHCF